MSTNDPMQAAIEPPTNLSSDLYGKIEISAQFMYTAKGEKPRAFVDGTDDPRRRSTEVSLSLTTIDAMGLTRPVWEKKHFTWTPAWSGVWESIQALGFDNLREFSSKWVKVELVPTGRTYTDKKSGEEKEDKAFKFVAVYGSESECIKAYESEWGIEKPAQEDDTKTAVALATVKALIPTVKGDLNLLDARLKAAKSPYTSASPEVMALLAEAAVPA